MKGETDSSLRAREVGASITLGTFVRTLSGNPSGRAAIGREQREQLETIAMRTEPRGTKARPITYVENTDLWKRNGGTPMLF
jgi:hypothetical protein